MVVRRMESLANSVSGEAGRQCRQWRWWTALGWSLTSRGLQQRSGSGYPSVIGAAVIEQWGKDGVRWSWSWFCDFGPSTAIFLKLNSKIWDWQCNRKLITQCLTKPLFKDFENRLRNDRICCWKNLVAGNSYRHCSYKIFACLRDSIQHLDIGRWWCPCMKKFVIPLRDIH